MRHNMFMMFAVTLILAASAWAAATESVLYNFNSVSGGADGYYPYAGVIADSAGNLYGTTYSGGKGYGVVYELSLSNGVWTESVLHTFTAGTTDGAYPIGGLAFDKSGNLYGVTYQGGPSNVGTVYELKKSGKSWTYSLIYNFAGYPNDGANPYDVTLIFDSKGNIYGTTASGGEHNIGTIFLLKQTKGKWSDNILHSFAGSTDGQTPYAGLTTGKNGFFYGTTQNGGQVYNDGTVYELFESRGLWVERPIYLFSGGDLGTYPLAPVSLDSAGNIYGTTYQGGTENLGVVFKLTEAKNKQWNETVLYNFSGGSTDGEYPYYGDGVIFDSKGNLYGGTYQGASTSNAGSVYELVSSKGEYHEDILHAFTGGSTDGCYVRAGLLLLKGNIYGTAWDCGSHGGGIVFEVKP
jgi:uncharacterized repeat protein (TIGR03803 family)